MFFAKTTLSFQGFNLPTELSESPIIAFKPKSIDFFNTILGSTKVSTHKSGQNMWRKKGRHFLNTDGSQTRKKGKID